MTINKYVLENGNEMQIFGDGAVGWFEKAIFDLLMSNPTVTLVSEQKENTLYLKCV